MKQRRTRQLDATRDVLAAATDHPSAEQVLMRVRDRLPGVSLGTIYRNLDKLRGRGELQVLSVAEGCARYDATVDPHDHFVCDSCGRVIDLNRSTELPDADQLASRGFQIRKQSTTVYGLCAECAEAARRKTIGRKAGTSRAPNDYHRASPVV